MLRCDYAGCRQLGVWQEDGWHFCSDHVLDHRALMAAERATRRPAKKAKPRNAR